MLSTTRTVTASTLAALAIAAGARPALAQPTARDPMWSPDGSRIVFSAVSEGVFQIHDMEADGADVRRLTHESLPFYYPSYNHDGTRIVFMSYQSAERSAVWTMNADGSNLRRLTPEAAVNADPRWSPDGKRIIFYAQRDGNDDIYMMDADGTNERRITDHPGKDQTPSFSPDGSKIAFVSDRDGSLDIWLMNADGTGARNLTSADATFVRPVWTPDGAAILCYRAVASDTGRLTTAMRINLESGEVVRLTDAEPSEHDASMSPDSSRIAYTSSSTGAKQVYVMNADGSGSQRITGPG